ncbi:uncharacterized protein [Henckelia pumila]|uniref:uncharacterized protein n=1 Tax=Henckelia pumila TaxID=405737 RepID=UPI003C6E6D56
MDSVATSGSGNGRWKKLDKTRRSWTAREEEVLIQSLKEVVTKGWKSENGFRAGYLNLLENAMQAAIPGTNLRGNPHINSKIHVWKKTYSTLVTLLSKSGVGWNDSENTIEVTDEAWEAIVKTDQSFRAMRHKQWTFFNDWSEIFGNDRAAGDERDNFQSALDEVLRLERVIPDEQLIPGSLTTNFVEVNEDSISETHTPTSKQSAGATSKMKKRKQANDTDESIATAINNLSHITKDTMSHLIKEMSSVEKISDVQDKALDALKGMK